MNKPLKTAVFIGITIFLVIWIFTIPAICPRFNFTETGQIGDTIGGISAPIIGIIGIYYVYKTLLQQINEKSYQLDLKALSDIESDLRNLKLVFPNGKSTEYNFYDKTVEFSGLNAMLILKQKLAVYEKQDKFKKLAIDQFVYDYGRNLKHLEIFLLGLQKKKFENTEELKFLNSYASKIYFSCKSDFDNLIDALRDKNEGVPENDPKEIKKQFLQMRKNIENMIFHDPLYAPSKL